MNPNFIFWFVVLWTYLLGSIPTGFWLMKFGKDVDIRQHGSGNIGMTNVWRFAGAKWGIATLLLDILKGVLAVWMAGKLDPDHRGTMVLAGLFVILGNLFPIFLRFKGGKGVGTSIGVFYSLLPIPSLIGTVVFGLVLWRRKIVSVSSLAGVTAMALASCHFLGVERDESRLALLICLLVWYGHRANLLRLLAGTERKIGSAQAPSPTSTPPTDPTQYPAAALPEDSREGRPS